MNLSKFDSFVICVSPLLMPYMFFIPGISWCHPLFFLSLIFHSISGNISKSSVIPWFLLGFSILFIHLLYIQTTGISTTLGFVRLLKYGLLISFIAVAYPRINKNTLAKTLLLFVVTNISALLLQYAVYFMTGTPLVIVLPFVPLVNSGIDLEGISTILTYNFRPGGLFLEPAHCSYYLFFAGLFLNSSNYLKNRLVVPLICISLFSTFSSFGFLSGLLLAFIFLRKSSFGLKTLIFLLSLAAMPFALVIASQIPQLERILDPESIAVIGRLSGGQYLIEQLNDDQRSLGLGYGNFEFDGFVNGVAFLRLSFGNIGIGMILFFILFYAARNYNHILVFYIAILIVMCFFTALIFTEFLLIVLLPFLAIHKTKLYKTFNASTR